MRSPLMLTVLLITVTANAGTVLHFAKGSIASKELAARQSFPVDQAVKGPQDYIIQYKQSVTELEKKELAKIGAEVFRYLPDDAVIVRLPQTVVDRLRQDERIEAVLPFKGDFKLAGSLPAISVFSQKNSVNVLITTFKTADATVLSESLKNNPRVQVLSVDDRYLAITADLASIQKLSQVASVEFIQPLNPMKSMHMTFNADDQATAPPGTPADYDHLDGYETGTKVMNFDSAWSMGFHGENQVIAFADTGLDMGDAANISADFKGVIKKGFFYGPGATDFSDPMGHGTHVAGSMAGRGVISGGKLKGGANAASLVPQGMWSPLIENLIIPPKMDKFFDAARLEGATVHSNSWGSPRDLGTYDSNAQKVDDYSWNNPDMLIVFAAGNSGIDANKDGKIDEGSVSSPGTAKNALTVGASENLVSVGGIQKIVSELRTAADSWPAEPIWSSKLSDNPNGIAMFSSRGPTADGRLKPEIVAPGTNILSTRSHVPDADVLWGYYGDDYAWSGGTSMATPLTAGAASVARQYLVEKMNAQSPSSALVKAFLLHTAKDLFPGQYGQGTPTQELEHRPEMNQGYGRVDMDAVVKPSSKLRKIDDNKSGVAQTESKDYSVNVDQGGKLLVNLVYTDAPGTPSSGKALVNVLSLSVVYPDGKIISKNDGINNNQIIELVGLSAGSYTIRVTGELVPMGKSGKQPYALVYSVF